MIRQDIKELETSPPKLRNFGLLVGGVFAVLGILWWMRGRPYFAWGLLPGVVLLFLGVLSPKSLKFLYIAWMSLAIVLGFVVSNVLLTVFFYLVIAPLGLTARLFGKDFLGLKLDHSAPSYWIVRDRSAQKSPQDYERQF